MSIPWVAAADWPAEEEDQDAHERDESHGEVRAGQQAECSGATEEENGAGRQARILPLVKVLQHLEEIGEITELVLGRGANLVDQRVDPVVIAVAVNELAEAGGGDASVRGAFVRGVKSIDGA